MLEDFHCSHFLPMKQEMLPNTSSKLGTKTGYSRVAVKRLPFYGLETCADIRKLRHWSGALPVLYSLSAWRGPSH